MTVPAAALNTGRGGASESSAPGPFQAWLQARPKFVKELLAGGVAGGVAKTCVAPFERTKILQQTGRLHTGIVRTLRLLLETEGVAGLWRGNAASVLRVTPYAAIHFTAYERYKHWLQQALHEPGPTPFTAVAAPDDGEDEAALAAVVAERPRPQAPISTPRQRSPVVDLVAGSTAGATAVIMTYPLDVLRTRMAWATEATDRGAAPLERPPAPSAVPAVPSCRRQLVAGAGLPGAVTASVGSSAGARQSGSTCSSSSGSVAAPAHGPRAAPWSQPQVHTMRGMVAGTLRAEGIAGLYRGMAPTLLGILPYAGLKFYIYESLKQWRAARNPDAGRPPTTFTLAAGAASGLFAQTVTYPLDVIRRRMQVHGLEAMTAPAAAHGGLAHPHPPAPRMACTLRAILAESGARGLFRGLSLNYIKVAPTTAIGFTVYDSLKAYMGTYKQDQHRHSHDGTGGGGGSAGSSGRAA